MAEVLGVVASGISVAQVAFQFISLVHKLQQFRDIPEELKNIVTDLEFLGRLVGPLIPILERSVKIDASSELLPSVIHCKEVALSLHELVARLNHHSNGSIVKRSLGVLKAGLRKDEVRTMQTRLESSKSSLLLALAMYSPFVKFLSFTQTES
jgi:hypothetical protein